MVSNKALLVKVKSQNGLKFQTCRENDTLSHFQMTIVFKIKLFAEFSGLEKPSESRLLEVTSLAWECNLIRVNVLCMKQRV